MAGFKPLLGYTVDNFDDLEFPVLASPKLDGIRALHLGVGLVSRTLKPIPNQHIQDLFGGGEFQGLDGELIMGEPTYKNCYQVTNSAVMSRNGEPDVMYYVFDVTSNLDVDYCERLEILRKHPALRRRNVILVEQVYIFDAESLREYETECVEAGYEGVMIRKPNTKYKQGRSTAKVGELGKIKRFADGEARIVAFEELHKNNNEKTVDELGHSERSSHKENMIPMDTLGALVVEDLVTKVRFNIGSGFSQVQRQEIWDNMRSWESRVVKYKHFPIGVKDLPRFPIFKGTREVGIDL